MGDHFNCLAQVDRTVPAQTQQRYVKTVTECGPRDLLSPNLTVTTSCTSTPIYETIVLNQDQRNAAYQQCRAQINGQRKEMELSQQAEAARPTTSSKQKRVNCFNTIQPNGNDVNDYQRRFDSCISQ